MKKRALSLLLASFAAACVVGGCGGGSNGSIIILDGESPTQKNALTVYGNRCDVYSIGVIESALQSFMSQNTATTAYYESAPEINYWQALDRRFATDNLDDVFMTEHDRLLTMTENGALADLSDAINENIFNDFARSQLYSEDGAIYAVPLGISTYGLYVNYGLLEKHGMQVPANSAEFTAVCDYFVSEGITPLICNNYSSIRSLILATGMYGTYSAADTAAEIEKFNRDPSALASELESGIDFVYGLIESGYIDLNETALTENLSGDLELFAAGNRPFMITGGWASATLKEMLSAGGTSLSYGIYPYPVLETGSVLVAQSDTLISVKKSGNEAAAKKLVSCLSTPEMLLALSESQSRFSVLKGQTQIYADSAIIPSASYLTKGKYVSGADVNLRIPLETYLTECGTMIINGESADAVKAHLSDLLSGVVGR